MTHLKEMAGKKVTQIMKGLQEVSLVSICLTDGGAELFFVSDS